MRKQDEGQASIQDLEETLYRKCLSKITGYFDDEVQGDEAAMATKTMNVLVKREGTQVHRDALRFAMIRTIFHDRAEDLAQAVKTLSPDFKKLPSA